MNKEYKYLILHDAGNHGSEGNLFAATETIEEAKEIIASEGISYGIYNIYELCNLNKPLISGLQKGVHGL